MDRTISRFRYDLMETRHEAGVNWGRALQKAYMVFFILEEFLSLLCFQNVQISTSYEIYTLSQPTFEKEYAFHSRLSVKKAFGVHFHPV